MPQLKHNLGEARRKFRTGPDDAPRDAGEGGGGGGGGRRKPDGVPESVEPVVADLAGIGMIGGAALKTDGVPASAKPDVSDLVGTGAISGAALISRAPRPPKSVAD